MNATPAPATAPGSSEADLSLRAVTKHFGGHAAVQDVSFDVPKGRFFSILGPSGCGKTTLLRMIAGFIEPTEGDIHIRGRSVRGVAPNQRPVRLVFQNLALFPMMSVAENIAFGLERRREGRREIAAKVARMLETVGLPGYGNHRVNQLSGGQKQRVAIARCLVLDPPVLLLDEPLGALDLKLREQMKLELKRLQEQVGTTFLYITHDQSEALVMSDKIAIMNRGRVEQIDTPFQCYYQPRTAFVAGFIGESNRWPGRVTAVEADAARVEIAPGLHVACRPDPALRAGDAVEVFVRAESFRLGSPQPPVNRLDGEVRGALFDGNAVRIAVRNAALAAEIVVALPPSPASHQVRRGDRLTLGWDKDSALCFPVRP